MNIGQWVHELLREWTERQRSYEEFESTELSKFLLQVQIYQHSTPRHIIIRWGQGNANICPISNNKQSGKISSKWFCKFSNNLVSMFSSGVKITTTTNVIQSSKPSQTLRDAFYSTSRQAMNIDIEVMSQRFVHSTLIYSENEDPLKKLLR